ncbi:hypothetical protein QTH97_29115 [Variovorax sp. J22R24]|uniref:hypothetical protein n=1 Tax=Variovorax gracilis TaxID=3053502 RepID=UPI002577529A|nr:hypothetical protein [Variovorax sp. J22R24]MDM0109036.1 hypothetical protein [Variovorax sp. J22R24]
MYPVRIGAAIVAVLLIAVFWRLLRKRATASDTGSPDEAAAIAWTAGARSRADICQVMHEESESLGERLRAAGMSMELRPCARPLHVRLDPSGLRVLLAQVVDLACRVMPSGGTLQMLVRADGPHAVVNFMDLVPEAHERRLGRCFNEASAFRSNRRHGRDALPLAGVALCARIAGEHQGRIYAAPSPLGSLGITLRLPLC